MRQEQESNQQFINVLKASGKAQMRMALSLQLQNQIQIQQYTNDLQKMLESLRFFNCKKYKESIYLASLINQQKTFKILRQILLKMDKFYSQYEKQKQQAECQMLNIVLTALKDKSKIGINNKWSVKQKIIIQQINKELQQKSKSNQSQNLNNSKIQSIKNSQQLQLQQKLTISQVFINLAECLQIENSQQTKQHFQSITQQIKQLKNLQQDLIKIFNMRYKSQKYNIQNIIQKIQELTQNTFNNEINVNDINGYDIDIIDGSKGSKGSNDINDKNSIKQKLSINKAQIITIKQSTRQNKHATTQTQQTITKDMQIETQIQCQNVGVQVKTKLQQTISKKQTNTLYKQLFNGELFGGFIPEILQQQQLYSQYNEQKNYLVNTLQQYTNRQIVKTRLLYRFDKKNTNNFHQYIDGVSNIVLIIKLTNNYIIGGYVEWPLQKGQVNNGPGFLASLTNQRFFQIDKKVKGAKVTSYDPYFFIFGNSQLRLKIPQTKIYSNFGIANKYFNSKEQKNPKILFGTCDKDNETQQYEIYKIYFMNQ